MNAAIDRLFQPQWAGGWPWMRWLFVAAGLRCAFPIAWGIGDAYGAPDMVLVSGTWKFAEYFVMTVPMAWGFWLLTMAGLALIGWGRGWALYAGLLAWLIGYWALTGHEALNVKAFDRLQLWLALGLLLSPAHETGLHEKWRSPVARWVVILIMGSIYGSTGFHKALLEPGWQDGSTLRYHYLHPYHGMQPLGIWMSGLDWPNRFMSWVTLIFECGFPFLVVFRRTNPWILLMGVGFHVGLWWMMHIPPFFWVSLCAYPVLLDPDVARSLYLRVQAWRGVSPASSDPVPQG